MPRLHNYIYFDTMTGFEKNFVRSIVDFDSDVIKVQEAIKNQYNVTSEYDANEMTLKIVSENNDSIDLINAKNFVSEAFGTEELTIIF